MLLRAKDGFDVCKGVENAVRSFVEDVRSVVSCKFFERCLTLTRFGGQIDPKGADTLNGGSKDDTIAIASAIGREDSRVIAVPSDKPLGISASINKAVAMYGAGRDWRER